MGVSGLLPLLKSIQKPADLKKFQGQTLGIDGYGWLHRAAYSCAVELAQDTPTDKFVTAAMHRVRMLCHFGIKPYMVFDGDYLPSKAATEDSRAKNRDAKKKAAMELLKAGKPSLATQEFQKCIDVTPEMATALIRQLQKMNLPYVVAPYEADAQLVYLERKGLIDGIISDDSDLLVFGAKRLLTKMDRYGACIEINRRDFCACREVSLTGWSDADFRRMAILSGCDYLEGLPSVGLKTAYRMLRKSKTPERVVRMLQFQGKRISENYLTQFYQAELTFLHQWVFCPEKQELVHLTELDGTRTAEEMPYIGSHVEPRLARAIAKGDVNPITKAPIALPATPTKRRHSQTISAVSSQPPAKPVTSYFKGHQRIPMGSMDPNCFSVDPQRIAQLTDGGAVPRVFPLPRPYLDETSRRSSPTTPGSSGAPRTRTSPRLQRRRTEPISNLLSGMTKTPVSRRSSANIGASSPALTPKTDQQSRPQKKARLCDESNEQDESPKQSKFFSAEKPSRGPRKAKSEAYLLSDDSIDEALMKLPDIDGFNSPKRGKSISVFEEPSQSPGRQSTHPEHHDHRQGPSEETAQTSIKDDTPQSPEPSPSPSKVSMPPPKLTTRLSAFSHTPSRETTSRLSLSSLSANTPASTATNSSTFSVFSAASTPATAASSVPSTRSSLRPTPLQRLGMRAMNMPSSPKPRLPPPTKPKAGGLPVNPSFVPLPKVDLREVEALNRPSGSEDQIYPDSEEEEEDMEAAPPSKLNLSRFAFQRA